MQASSRRCADWGIGLMDRLKLKWYVFTFLLGFCALLIAVLWLFQTVLLTNMYQAIRKSELQKAVTLVKQNIDNPDLQSILGELERDKEIIIMPTQEFTPPQGYELSEGRPQDGRGIPRPETITQTEVFTMLDGKSVSLTFYAMISPVEATTATLQIQLYIITGIMVLLAVIIAMVIAKKISKPIEDINNGAKLLASGKYDTQFSAKGFLEIQELSDTLSTAATELSKVESLRRELLANVSHDLRTPLALIYSYAEMMHDFPNEIAPEQTQVIMDETQRLTSLVNDVLDMSQLENGTMELTRTHFNLTETISSVIDRMSELVKREGFVLRFDHGEDVYVKADQGKITQAFYNLLINAIHYSGEEKVVTIRQHVTDGMVRIEVIDSGIGIDPKDLPYIWDRYYKVDKKHKRAVTGTGLGLSIVKKIIALHGGTCGVQSETPKGSMFWFMIQT